MTPDPARSSRDCDAEAAPVVARAATPAPDAATIIAHAAAPRAARRAAPDPTLVVALCRRLDLPDLYGAAFAARGMTLLPPEAVSDPSAVAAALAWKPQDHAFARFPNLRAVFSIAAGVDGLLPCPSLPADAPLIRMVDDDQADQMAGFAVWLVVNRHRGMQAHVDAQAEGRWSRPRDGRSPKLVRVGVLGFGHQGRRVGRALARLGYLVAGYARRPPEPQPGVTTFHGDGLDAFLARADILINLLPLTAHTRGFLTAARLRRLPRGAYLINLGRAGQLAEADLLAALDDGTLSGAALDVFETEPLPPAHRFWSDPRILVTPHTAADVEPAQVADGVALGLADLAAGRTPRGVVDRRRGY